jgi:hypothetical protein
MAFESENRTNRSGLLGHEMDQNLNAYLSVRFGRPLEGAPNNAPQAIRWPGPKRMRFP